MSISYVRIFNLLTVSLFAIKMSLWKWTMSAWTFLLTVPIAYKSYSAEFKFAFWGIYETVTFAHSVPDFAPKNTVIEAKDWWIELNWQLSRHQVCCMFGYSWRLYNDLFCKQSLRMHESVGGYSRSNTDHGYYLEAIGASMLMHFNCLSFRSFIHHSSDLPCFIYCRSAFLRPRRKLLFVFSNSPILIFCIHPPYTARD